MKIGTIGHQNEAVKILLYFGIGILFDWIVL